MSGTLLPARGSRWTRHYRIMADSRDPSRSHHELRAALLSATERFRQAHIYQKRCGGGAMMPQTKSCLANVRVPADEAVLREQLEYLIDHTAEHIECGCSECQRYLRVRSTLLEIFGGPQDSSRAWRSDSDYDRNGVRRLKVAVKS